MGRTGLLIVGPHILSLVAAVIFSLSLAGVAASQGNTSLGTGALQNNTTGNFNTAIGLNALFSNTTGCPLFTYYPVSVVAKSLSILLVLTV
jgi:hypothetical protein